MLFFGLVLWCLLLSLFFVLWFCFLNCLCLVLDIVSCSSWSLSLCLFVAPCVCFVLVLCSWICFLCLILLSVMICSLFFVSACVICFLFLFFGVESCTLLLMSVLWVCFCRYNCPCSLNFDFDSWTCFVWSLVLLVVLRPRTFCSSFLF